MRRQDRTLGVNVVPCDHQEEARGATDATASICCDEPAGVLANPCIVISWSRLGPKQTHRRAGLTPEIGGDPSVINLPGLDRARRCERNFLRLWWHPTILKWGIWGSSRRAMRRRGPAQKWGSTLAYSVRTFCVECSYSICSRLRNTGKTLIVEMIG